MPYRRGLPGVVISHNPARCDNFDRIDIINVSGWWTLKFLIFGRTVIYGPCDMSSKRYHIGSLVDFHICSVWVIYIPLPYPVCWRANVHLNNSWWHNDLKIDSCKHFLCCNYHSDDPICLHFCICHDSSAVLECANLRADCIISLQVGVVLFFFF